MKVIESNILKNPLMERVYYSELLNNYTLMKELIRGIYLS
jgi:hypothetical protein